MNSTQTTTKTVDEAKGFYNHGRTTGAQAVSLSKRKYKLAYRAACKGVPVQYFREFIAGWFNEPHKLLSVAGHERVAQ